MQVGFAKRDVSPPLLPEGDLSIPILGWRWERARAYREIHDPLYARAMALQCGGARAVVFACDLFGDARGFTNRCAEELQRLHGVPAENVFFGCTHTHTSPDTLNICPQEVASWWIDQLVEQLVGAGAAALAALEPATLHWGEAEITGIAVNRRAPLVENDEKRREALAPGVRERTTALDQTLRVLCAARPGGRPLGAIANFACHPVIMQTMPMISADYCGPAAKGVEQALGDGFVCLYLNGPCGDVNPACGDSGDYRDCEKTGGAVAAAAARLVPDALGRAPVPAGPIRGQICSVEVARQTLANLEEMRAEEKRLAAACREADATGLAAADERHPLRHLCLLQERLAVADMPERQTACVHVLRAGDLHFASFPGELLTALGQDARRGIGGRAMLAECSRGHHGYICPREAYRLGGYELGPGTWSWLAEGGGESMVEAAVAAAEEMRAARCTQ